MLGPCGSSSLPAWDQRLHKTEITFKLHLELYEVPAAALSIPIQEKMHVRVIRQTPAEILRD